MKPALGLAATAMALVVCVSAASGSAAVRNGRIAYAFAGGADRFELYTVNPDGTHRRQLTTSSTLSSYSPSYSPRSGTEIIFVRAGTQRDLWRIDTGSDSTGPWRLTWTRAIDEVDPSWSPSGAEIAFAVASPKTKAGIWIIDLRSRSRRQLTSGDAADPSWSPDGTQIAFTAKGVIWTVAATGGTPTQVTFPGTYSDGTPYSDFDPAWSPDGTRILFASDRGDAVDSADQIDLWVVNLAAASPIPNATRLTHSASRDERDPAWSPDGTKVVYDTTGTFHGASSAQLGIVSATGASPHLITHVCGDCAYLNVEPSWQPLR